MSEGPPAKRRRGDGEGTDVSDATVEVQRYVDGRTHEDEVEGARQRFRGHANAHPRDARIVFDDSLDAVTGKRKHEYRIDGKVHVGFSLSGLARFFFFPFDATAQSKRSADAANKRTVEELNKKRKDAPALTVEDLTPEQRITAEKFRNEWEAAAEGGRAKHLLAEQLCEAAPLTPAQIAEFPLGVCRFLAAHPSWVVFRTEWSIYDESLGVVGQLDLLCYDTRYAPDDDKYWVLVDWKFLKTAEHMERVFGGVNGTAWHPLFRGRLPASSAGEYAIQLNAYRTVLARQYDIHVTRMVDVVVPRNAFDTYHEHWVEVLDLTEAFALACPWNWLNPRHVGTAEDLWAAPLRGSMLTSMGGATRVRVRRTGDLIDEAGGEVWVGPADTACGCDDKPAACKPKSACPKLKVLLPESIYACTYAPFSPNDDVKRRVALAYERDLLTRATRPCLLVRAMADLYGKTLVTWSSTFECAALLARYVNALHDGKLTLPPDAYTTITPPIQAAFQLEPVAEPEPEVAPVPVVMPVPEPLAVPVAALVEVKRPRIRCGYCHVMKPTPLSLNMSAPRDADALIIRWRCAECDRDLDAWLGDIDVVGY